MAAIQTRFTTGNQARMIQQAFSGRDMEKSALNGGLHPALAGLIGARNYGGGGWLGNAAALGAIDPVSGVPTFSTTVTSVGDSGPGWLNNIIGTAGQFIQSRWGQQRGTITYDAQGNITQKQAQGVPIQTQAPYIVGGTIPGLQSNVAGLGTGLALGTGTMLLIGGGALLLVLVMSKGKR